jgi:hypothetical protein
VTARSTKAARATQTRRQQRAVWRGGTAQRRNSGEPSAATRCTGTSTSGTSAPLTSLLDSGRLHDNEEATTAENDGGSAARVPAAAP